MTSGGDGSEPTTIKPNTPHNKKRSRVTYANAAVAVAVVVVVATASISSKLPVVRSP